MAKHLSAILKNYSDVISGKLPASKVSALTTGKEPGVDYAGKMPDEREFVASHSVEKHPDRNGNGDDLFNASNIKQAAVGERHGNVPDPKSKNTYKQANEEVEPLEEISKETLLNYKMKASSDPKRRSGVQTAMGKMNPGNPRFPAAKVPGSGPDALERAKMKMSSTFTPEFIKNISDEKEKAKNAYLNKEEFELEENLGKAIKKMKNIYKGTGPDGSGDPREMKKRLKDNPELTKDIASRTEKLGGMAELQRRVAKKLVSKMNESFSEAKDPREYDYEGEMAISQIKSIMNHSEQLLGMLKPETNLPEWVQSKITLAKDYIQTAADYYATEMTEASKCNMSEAGSMCEVHGNKACPTEENEGSAEDKEPRRNGKDKPNVRKLLTDKKSLQEKAESVAQQKLMAMALAYKRGEMKDASEQVKKLASSMTEKQLKDYAKTKHEGLPQKVQNEQSAPASTPITFPVTNSREGFKL